MTRPTIEDLSQDPMAREVLTTVIEGQIKGLELELDRMRGKLYELEQIATHQTAEGWVSKW